MHIYAHCLPGAFYYTCLSLALNQFDHHEYSMNVKKKNAVAQPCQENDQVGLFTSSADDGLYSIPGDATIASCNKRKISYFSLIYLCIIFTCYSSNSGPTNL